MSVNTGILVVADIQQDEIAQQVGGFWELVNTDKINQIEKWDEIRKYIYATDTSATTAATTPWNNRTTRPKLTWIHDQLIVHLMSALFPNDNFFRWHGYPERNRDGAEAINRLQVHKLRNPHVKFRETMKMCLMDWIQTGNCMAGVEYIDVKAKSLRDEGAETTVFRGARPYRIDPRRAVLDPHSDRFEDSSFAFRTLTRRDEFFRNASPKYDPAVMDTLTRIAQTSEFPKDVLDALEEQNIQLDGVNTSTFWEAGRVEIIEFFGSIFDRKSGEYHHNRHIIIADRRYVLLNEEIDTLLGIKPVVFSSYRKRPDNLWGMGPLENLIGMQYRNDHLENAKADALDLCIYPIRKITGDATEEEYFIEPGAEWHVSSQGDVELLYPDPRTLMFDSQIQQYELEMEMLAGIPREQAGFRTPGEKTQFEVSQLLALGEQPFSEKVKEFEGQFLEPLLNLLWELTMRNFNEQDLASMSKEDQAVMSKIKVEDLKQDGRFFPIGSKHFQERQAKKQGIIELVQVGTQLAPEHTGRLKALTAYQREAGLEEEDIIGMGVGIIEAVQTEQVKQQIQQKFQGDNPDAQTDPTENLSVAQDAATGRPRQDSQ